MYKNIAKENYKSQRKIWNILKWHCREFTRFNKSIEKKSNQNDKVALQVKLTGQTNQHNNTHTMVQKEMWCKLNIMVYK